MKILPRVTISIFMIACVLSSTPIARADSLRIITPSSQVVEIEGEVNRYVDNIYGADTESLTRELLHVTDKRSALNYLMSGLGDKIFEMVSLVEREPREDYVTFVPNSHDRFVYHPAVDGVRVRWDRVLLDVEKVLHHDSEVVRIWHERVPAEVNYEGDIGKYTTLRGSYVTYFNMDNVPRVHNIRLAGDSISGTVVKAGERFSFNEVVGKRTLDRGYQIAPVIVKGELVDGVGGGVCQVSTTLYNAVTLAGLKSVKKSAHSMTVSYVAPSRDVTVSEYIDYVFENDSGEDIYIECDTRANYIKINVYGLYTDEEVQLQTEYEDRDGYRYSTAYIVKSRRGVVVSRSKLRQDKYILPTPPSEQSIEEENIVTSPADIR